MPPLKGFRYLRTFNFDTQLGFQLFLNCNFTYFIILDFKTQINSVNSYVILVVSKMLTEKARCIIFSVQIQVVFLNGSKK